MRKIRLLIADDQAMFREGLRTLLELQPDFEIVGEAADGNDAVAQAVELKPEIVLMDLRMPVLNGIEATRRMASVNTRIRVIVLTTFQEDVEVFAALKAGAVGYLLKTSSSDQLCSAIRMTSRGESFLEPSVTSRVLAEFARLGAPRPAKEVPAGGALSPREAEVLRSLAAGQSNKEIALQLNLAEGTVKNHLSNIFAKLGVLDRTQAALRGRDLGYF
jgi:DNA-binding NarL/FixJ family response regulator